MDWFLSVLAIVGDILLIRKSKWGWVIFVFANALWIPYSLNLKQYGLIPSCIFFVVLDVIAIRQWSLDDKRKTKD